jgi:hypothetical protein
VRDSRGDLGYKGDVVRGVPTDGGKGRGGETVTPGLVNEHPVEADKDGISPTVGPSKLAVPQGKLDEAQGVDSGVEKVSIRDRKVIIVSVSRVPGEVKSPAMIQGISSPGSCAVKF